MDVQGQFTVCNTSNLETIVHVSISVQSSQLSRIARETHAFYAKLTLTRFVSSHSRISS